MKKQGIVEHLLKRPVTIIMLTLLMVGFGLFSLSKLKITLWPSFDIPIVAVSTSYRNVAPEDIQRILIEPIEAAISSVEGIETMDSNSRRGSAFIRLSLFPGTDARRVELDVREAIDRIRNQLPREASQPVIFQFDPESAPIMQLSLQASNRSLDELRNLSVEMVEPMLERLPGVAAADTRGGLERTVYVHINPQRLAQYRVSTSEIENALRQNNVQIPVGNLVVDRVSYSVRAEAMYTSIDEIGNTIVRRNPDGNPVRISDLAVVEDSFADVTTLVEVNGKNSVTIEIQKQSDANTLDVAYAVLDEIEMIQDKLPVGATIQVLTNSGQFIENSIFNLAQSATYALFLVLVILIVFLGGWRASVTVALSIPISLAGTFAAMYFTGITLNIISIFGLALAVGLLVDNSIVVLDGIVAKLEEGKSRFQAALEGTNEVKGALIGATLTTLAVFIPILFVEGFTGMIAKDLAWTISLAISFSFITAVVLVPVFSTLFLRNSEFEKKTLALRLFSRFEDRYAQSLRWLLTHRSIGILLFMGVLISTWYLFKITPTENFPEGDSGEVSITIELPTGTNLVQTAGLIREMSEQLVVNENVETVVTNIGSRGWRSDYNLGRISLTLRPDNERTVTTDQFALQLRRQFDYPGATIRVSSGGGGFRGGGGGFGGGLGAIRVSLIGPDIEVLKAISNRIEEVMMQDTLVISVDNPRVNATPELVYRVDRERVSRMGSNLSEVGNALKTQTRGTLTGYYREDGREIPIEVRTDQMFRTDREQLDRMELLQVGDQRVPVSSLGYFEAVEGYDTITRRDRETLLDVSIQVAGRGEEQRQRITEMFENEIVLPDGYRYEFTGSFRDQQRSMGSLLNALLFALLLTYMVMAAKFENLTDPFVIMLTVPLGFLGALGLLYVLGTALSVVAGLGMVVLVGIVVNNGIVLLDYVKQYTTGIPDEMYMDQFIRGAKRRVRPILLTSLTTICSMIPLAIGLGTGAEIWSPLALVVIGGLLLSPLLTLYIIPVLTISFSSRKRRALDHSIIIDSWKSLKKGE
ncbi:MAG: efflux RND transporter permease subunit [Cyclonatronaceae bacterium]